MPQYYDTNCLRCGVTLISNTPHELCLRCYDELRDPDSSALVDYIFNLQSQAAVCPDCHQPLVNGKCPALAALKDVR
jgi:hypothetical protein